MYCMKVVTKAVCRRTARRFVTGPHITDVSFKRIGAALAAAKLAKGVTLL